MAEYPFQEIETKWQQRWSQQQLYKTNEDAARPKYYVLDMFPYPSGAGLHVGHPLGYIASDIVARFKRLEGYNVLHPMGYDSFGLPAEQYAIQTGQHPAITTAQNIARYREQLDKMGFSFDWSREVKTSDPAYYKWTQWIFLQLFHAWYNPQQQKAEPISSLIKVFENEGFAGAHPALTGNIEHDIPAFTAAGWQSFDDARRENILQNFRLAYLSEAYVNWCPALGTVLANEEVKDGVSERGGYPVERKLMKQWSMRITAYADRLEKDLDLVDWSESIKETQRNWIGKSQGASVFFDLQSGKGSIEVFTTRPDTIFGVTFVTLAPEHELVRQITTNEYRQAVEEYITYAKNRSERDRMADVKKITGQFTGAFAVHPFTGEPVQVWIGDYVLAGYGTGAVMAVPAHDSRDHAFAKHFNLEIKQVVEAPEGHNIQEESYDAKTGKAINSSFLDGLDVKDAIKKAIAEIEKQGKGRGKTNYRLRDAIFGRQRYWGEPIPIYYDNGIPKPLSESELPLVLPEVDKFLPTETGEPPLGRAKNWKYQGEYEYELSTMPGWAGSSWYLFRYMDPHNGSRFASPETLKYWNQVDLYIGGAEHATGHLLYSRFWTKFLFDMGYVGVSEPFKKLINQGMIQGISAFVYRIDGTNTYVSKGLKDQHKTTDLHVDVNFVQNNVLDTNKFKTWREEYANAEFILEDGKYLCGSEVEKMSKSKWNVVSPDDIVRKYGADTLRLYEMFLGPMEQSKPWNTNGIEGVYRFLNKLWRLFHDEKGALAISREAATPEELKVLHRAIKKVREDINHFSFNTSVSTFMITVNELSALKCNKAAILEPLLVILSPYAPHIAEELWSLCGYTESITHQPYPAFNEAYLVENAFSYPISINGKVRTNIEFALDMEPRQIEDNVLQNETVQRWLEGKPAKKVIVVKGRIVNVVI